MSRRANGGLALLALLLAGAGARAQEAPDPAGTPTSILPDIFGTAPAPEPGDAPPPPDTPAGPASAPPAPGMPPPRAEPAAEAAAQPEEPAGPVRAVTRAGLISTVTSGLAPGLFASSDGRFLAGLLVRLDGPLAGRWAQIPVQRALASQADPPPGIDPGDWLAARARALAALGLATDAHRMVMRVLRSAYSPRLTAAAAHVALAAGDPVGLCPLADEGRALSGDGAAFVLADAMCAALFGDPFSANALLEEARRTRLADPLDIQLAERIASIAGGTRGAGNPVWAEVDKLTAWRIGLSGAAGITIPDSLVDQASATERAWMVRLPRVALATRARLAPEAAASGALSAAELRRILALEAAGTAIGALDSSPGGRLRRAYAAQGAAERVAALEALFDSAPAGSATAWGLMVAGGDAAAAIRPSAGLAAAAPALVAAMVAGGHAEPARDWWPVLDAAGGAPRARAWAMLAALDDRVPDGADRFADWAETSTPVRAALVRAGLAALGRDVGDAPPAQANPWAAALDAALAGGRSGEVLLLVATGLQGPLDELSPDQFRRAVAALGAIGLADEARLLVAEAAAR